MQDTSVDYTLESKEDFERDCTTRNVIQKHYPSDNGKFVENNFKQDYENKMQHLTF